MGCGSGIRLVSARLFTVRVVEVVGQLYSASRPNKVHMQGQVRWYEEVVLVRHTLYAATNINVTALP